MAQVTPTPSISANPDDTRRAPSRSRSRSAGRSGGAAALIANAMLVVVVVALGVVAWMMLTQQGQLEASQQALSDATARVRALEERLRLTDETITESGADTSEQIAFWDSEIRKLWDMGNKRNRGWIEDNRANIQKATDALASAQSDVTTMKGTVSRLETTVERQRDVADKVTELDMTVQRLADAQRTLADKANQADHTSRSLKATVEGSLEARLADLEEDIRAIDADRARVNSAIAELRQSATGPAIGP